MLPTSAVTNQFVMTLIHQPATQSTASDSTAPTESHLYPCIQRERPKFALPLKTITLSDTSQPQTCPTGHSISCSVLSMTGTLFFMETNYPYLLVQPASQFLPLLAFPPFMSPVCTISATRLSHCFTTLGPVAPRPHKARFMMWSEIDTVSIDASCHGL